jgi:hypothetical protein
VPHLRDGLIVAKVGHFRGSENPDTPNPPHAVSPQTTPKMTTPKNIKKNKSQGGGKN